MRPLLLALPFLVAARPAQAAKPTLELLPPDKLAGMTELLRHGDVALIESHPDGKLRQIAIMTLVATPPQLVHEVVADLAKYPEFVRNMSKCTVTKNPDGTVDQAWVISYSLVSFNGVTRHRFHPEGQIDLEAVDPEDNARFRWEFHPAPGGTVLVMYGYTDVMHSNALIRSLVNRAPTMEHGLALATQLVQVRAVRARAEKLAGPNAVPPAPKGRSPGFGFLLDRGRVAVLRTLANGRLADLSVLDRIGAPREKVESAITTPGGWSAFMDATSSRELKRDADGIAYQATTDLPIVSWDTRFLMRADGKGGVDAIGVEGDLRGARHRWDLSPLAPDRTLAVLRASQDLAARSIVLRTLFGQEPAFEHGVGVALGLLSLKGIRARAEGAR